MITVTLCIIKEFFLSNQLKLYEVVRGTNNRGKLDWIGLRNQKILGDDRNLNPKRTLPEKYRFKNQKRKDYPRFNGKFAKML